MRPVLFEVGGVPVGAYTAAHVVGLVVAVAVLLGLGERRDRRRLATVAATTVVGVWVGARVTHSLLHLDEVTADPDRLVSLGAGGLALYGGLVGGALAAGAASRALELPWWPLVDRAVIAGGLGVACVRVGCFLHGCCAGRTTDLPWGVTFPVGSPAWTDQVGDDPVALVLGGPLAVGAVHPTQLYEMAAAVLAAALAWWLLGRGAPAGVSGLVAAIGFTAARWCCWALRHPHSEWDTTPLWPVVYATVIVVLAALVWRRLAGPDATEATSGAPDAASTRVCGRAGGI